MKVSFERIINNPNSSFRLLHINQPVKELSWEYHYHPEIELVCVLYGRGSRHVGYHKGLYTNGDLVLIGSNIPHSGFGITSVDPHEEFVVQFKEEILRLDNDLPEFRAIAKLLELSKYGILFPQKTKNIILPKLIEMEKSSGIQRYLILLEILNFLAKSKDYELLNDKIMPYSIINKHKNRLQTIFTIVEKNYHTEIDIQEVANKVNLTLPAFCNFFKKSMQISFTEFINRYRIDKACFFLLQDKTISECSYLCGFNNVTYFNRIFKKYSGFTPSDFIKQNRIL